MKQARSEVRKQAKLTRLEKAVELQMNLEDRAAARRLMRELAEMERDRIRWAAQFKVQVRPEKPATRTSPVRKRPTITPMSGSSPRHDAQRAASSWVIDDRGMRGVIWQQSYLGRKSPRFYRGAARDNWEYDVRDEAVLLDGEGEPIIVSNMGEHWVEIGAAWQAMEDASTRKNAKIQIRAIAPFDADMSQQEMIAALQHFCKTVLAPLGLPYSAVIHAPPKHGDERNFHPHLAFSLRPMRRIEPYCWEVADEVRGELDGKDGVQMLRHLWAHSMSDAAEQAQRNMRYTGLGYGARGLNLDPGTHLGEARAAIVARGGQVWAHERNRITNARNAARRAIRDADKKIEALTRVRDAALASIAAEGEGMRQVKRLTAARSVAAKAPLRSAQRRRMGPAPAILIPAKPPAEHRPLIAARATAAASKQRPSTLASSMAAVRMNIPAKRLLSTTQPPVRPTPYLTSSTPADKSAPPLTCSAPPAQRRRLIKSSAVGVAPPRRMTRAMVRHHVGRLEAARPAPFAAPMLEPSPRPSTSPAKPTLIPSAAIATDASFATRIDELLLALGIARAKRDKEAAARRRVREADPDWIAPFEADGSPTTALRDLLLTIARTPAQLKIAEDGPIDARRATEPVRDLLDIWRNDAGVHPLVRGVLARAGGVGPARWPEAITDLMEDHDRLRIRLAENIAVAPQPVPADPVRAAARLRRARTDAIERSTSATLQSAPTLDQIPLRAWLEAHPLTPHGPDAPQFSGADRARLDHLVKSDAYVADYGGGTVEVEHVALKAIGADGDWQARPDIQTALTAIRAEQQRIVSAMTREADHRALDFAKSRTRFWPRDLEPDHLHRLDQWADDPGFQHDVSALELRIDVAHADHARERRRAQDAASRPIADTAARLTTPIPDGFGGLRDTPAPTFNDTLADVRVAAFDADTGRPTEQLLMLLKFAGEGPRKIEVAADGWLMVMPGAPAIMPPLLHGWRYDDRVAGLVTATVRASREAGRAVWPEEIAAAVRAFAARSVAAGAGRPQPDLSNVPSRE